MPSDDSNVISLALHKRNPRNPPDRLYRRILVRPGYHILVSLAPEFDARVYYVSRNYKLHPSGWIAQCEQTFMIPADPWRGSIPSRKQSLSLPMTSACTTCLSRHRFASRMNQA